jgi:hypothetical protein
VSRFLSRPWDVAKLYILEKRELNIFLIPVCRYWFGNQSAITEGEDELFILQIFETHKKQHNLKLLIKQDHFYLFCLFFFIWKHSNISAYFQLKHFTKIPASSTLSHFKHSLSTRFVNNVCLCSWDPHFLSLIHILDWV